jgi:hypothetical protein
MEKKVVRLVLLSTALTAGILMYTSSFNEAKAVKAPVASAENGRPLKSDGNGTYCCENSGTDCGAACCN